jgi:hypothetical protein
MWASFLPDRVSRWKVHPACDGRCRDPAGSRDRHQHAPTHAHGPCRAPFERRSRCATTITGHDRARRTRAFISDAGDPVGFERNRVGPLRSHARRVARTSWTPPAQTRRVLNPSWTPLEHLRGPPQGGSNSSLSLSMGHAGGSNSSLSPGWPPVGGSNSLFVPLGRSSEGSNSLGRSQPGVARGHAKLVSTGVGRHRARRCSRAALWAAAGCSGCACR